MFSTGRGDTAHCFLESLGPRRLKQRWATKMKRAIIVVFIAVLLSSCVGVIVQYPHTGADPHSAPSTTRARVVQYSEDRNPPVVNRQMVLDAWGKPDRVTLHENQEKWLYHDGYLWSGLLVYIVLPLPLVLPLEHRYVAINFLDGVVVNIETRDEAAPGFLCFLVRGKPEDTCIAEAPPSDVGISNIFLDKSRNVLGGSTAEDVRPSNTSPIKYHDER